MLKAEVLQMPESIGDSVGGAPTPKRLWSDRPGEWFVLHVKSRQEKALHAELSAMKCSAFLPLVGQSRVHGHRKSRVELPLFGGYVFLKGRKQDAYAADRTKRVVNILEVPDQEAMAWELASIEAAVGSGASLAELRSIVVGTAVEVRTGEFKGFQGVVESLNNPQRLVVQIAYMNRALSLQLDACQVEPLRDDPPAAAWHGEEKRR